MVGVGRGGAAGEIEEVGSETGGLKVVEPASTGTNDRNSGVMRAGLGELWRILSASRKLPSSLSNSPSCSFALISLYPT